MTNAQIIFNEAVELMKNGKIGKTGRQFETEDENGNKIMLDEPEDIHTFQSVALQFEIHIAEHSTHGRTTLNT